MTYRLNVILLKICIHLCQRDIVWFTSQKSIELVETDEIGSVKLLQAPVQPMEILKFASSTSHSHGDDKFNIEQIIASIRPRELLLIISRFRPENLLFF